ncbi:MAG: polysaccharide deacetylase family protein [Clostridia bacterium]|nr:polysaccharide deacetylase family protein [Clostridia bacterium]
MKRLTALFLCLLLVLSAVCASAAEFKFSIRNGDRNEKRLCITVDDCSNTEMLQNIFNLSQELGVPMTFFTLGYVLKDEDRELWRSIAESDCEIGNHTYWHESLPKLPRNEIIKTLDDTQIRLDEVLGYHYPMQVMRPPYGNTRIGNESNIHVVRSVEAAGYDHAILWDVSQTNPKKCLKAYKNGSILLFHTIEKDWLCLAEVLPVMKEEGYEFVTVSEMIGKEPVVISPLPAPEETQQPTEETEPQE